MKKNKKNYVDIFKEDFVSLENHVNLFMNKTNKKNNI